MSLKKPYQALTRQPNLSDQVVRQLMELISGGELQPGECLPSERELAEYFQVSRTVIREAIRSLIAKGLVEVQAGSRAVVSIPPPSMVAESMSFLLRLNRGEDAYARVAEVRHLLEVEIAGLAAERATEEDIWDLESLIKAMETSHNVEQFALQDVEFHATLAQATRNELFSVMLDSLVDIMLEIRHLSLALSGSRENALEHHRNILEMIKARDSAGARQAMRAHLENGQAKLHQALQEESKE
ncbi:MAG: FadR/GntR family transcriptional regulator [Anaerolineales bacterium]|jgi:GntR family transcriptional repressor for pyruvate dehydrogenase complex